MIPFEVADLVVVAARVLDLDTDAVLELLDVDAARTALTEMSTHADPARPECPAAALLHALVRHRPLERGNQRVALLSMVQFLALNGWQVDLDPPTATRSVLDQVSAGTLPSGRLADWLAPRLHAAGGSGEYHDAEEAPMFERFTDRARRVLVLAQEEARTLNHCYIGTEHILLGLIQEREGVAAKALESLGIALQGVHRQVGEIIGLGQEAPSGHIPFTPRAKKVLELSLREATQLGHNYIGTEHILLGLIREGDGVAARVLTQLGADLDRVRQHVLKLLCGVADPAMPPHVLAELRQLRRDKDAAIDAGDFERAAALRERERKLLLSTDDPQHGRLSEEIERLRTLLREHGIDPDEGTSRTA